MRNDFHINIRLNIQIATANRWRRAHFGAGPVFDAEVITGQEHAQVEAAELENPPPVLLLPLDPAA